MCLVDISGHKFQSSLLRKSPKVIDCGIKYGEFAIPFLKRFGGRVYGLEPTGASIRRAREEARRAGVRHSIVFARFAVWKEAGKMPFYLSDTYPQINSLFEDSLLDRVVFVPTVSLSDVIRHWSFTDLLKMDIEGAEWEALWSVPIRLFQRVGQIAVEAHVSYSSGRTVDDMMELLTTAGFDMYKEGGGIRLDLWGNR